MKNVARHFLLLIPTILLLLNYQLPKAWSQEPWSGLTLESTKVFGVPQPINYKLKYSNNCFWGINKTGNSLVIVQFNRSKIFLDTNNSAQIKTIENLFDENAFLGDFEIINDSIWCSLNYFNNGYVYSSLLEYNTKTDECVFYPFQNEYSVTYEANLTTIISYDEEKNMIYFINNNCGMLLFFSLENKQWLTSFVDLNKFYVTDIEAKNETIYLCGKQVSVNKGFVGLISLKDFEMLVFLNNSTLQFDAFIFDLEENVWCLSKSERILSQFNSNRFIDYDLNPIVKVTGLILDSMQGNIWLTDNEGQRVYRFCLLNKAFALHFETAPLFPVSFVSDAKNFTWGFGTTNNGCVGFTCIEKAYDLNNDCKVDMKDIGIVIRSLWKTRGDLGFVGRIDFQSDGIINLKDLAYIVKYYRSTLY